MERFQDEAVRDERPVVPGRVDEIDAQLDDAPEHILRSLRIGGFAPDAGPRQLHGAEAETPHFEVSKTSRSRRMYEIGHGRHLGTAGVDRATSSARLNGARPNAPDPTGTPWETVPSIV